MEASSDANAVNHRVAEQRAFVEELVKEIARVVVGQEIMVERVLIGLLSGGHCLLQGVPGLAKTLTVKTVAGALGAAFHRVQFTPDLLPADITGTTIFNPQTGAFSTKKGPVFANLVLADEINRAPAKVQSALLEAMEEGQVTIGDTSHRLPDPFIVMATQNPIEHEGTYELPEAQLDRFMLMIQVGYPSKAEERQIMDRVTAPDSVVTRPVASLDQVRAARRVASQIYIDDKIRDYVVDLVHATRNPAASGMPDLAAFIEYGASPRASIALLSGARAHAFLRGRGFVTPDDVRAIGADVLRHRIVLNYQAEAEEVTSDAVIQRLFHEVGAP